MNTVDRRHALQLARRIGCAGAHEYDGQWMPCASRDELLAVSRGAEQKSVRRKRKRIVTSRRGNGWEHLKERPVRSLHADSTGITSSLNDITDTGKHTSSGTVIGGGYLGGIVDGSPGDSYGPNGEVGAIQGKKMPKDKDRDGWIYEGTPKRRFIGIQALVEGVESVRNGTKPRSTSRQSERKPRKPTAVAVTDSEVPRSARRQASTAISDDLDSTIAKLSDATGTPEPIPKKTFGNRYGRAARKPEQELTPEGAALRRKNAAMFPRGVRPKGIKSQTSKAELDRAGKKTTAEFFGLDPNNRTLNQPGLSDERKAVYDAIAHAMVYGDPENPIDLPKSEEPTMHIMGGGPASGKSYLRQAGFFDIPDRSQAAHVEADEGRMMLPEYDGMLREMGGSVESTEALGAMNQAEAVHLARLANDIAIKGGHDIVMDSTGDGGPRSFLARIQQGRDNGYKIKAHYATTSISSAVDAAKERARVEQRGVDPKELIETHVDVTRAVLYGLKNNLFDELTLVDNQDYETPVVFAEFKAGKLTVHNMEMWDAFVKKAVASPVRFPDDYFVNNPFKDEDLDDWRAKVAVPKLRGKNADRVKQQDENTVVVLSPDKGTVWYIVSAKQATNDDYRKMLATEPPQEILPMKVNDDALYRIRSGRLMPHIPDLPPDDRIPAMTRRSIRLAAMVGKTLDEAGIADTPKHQKEYDEIRATVLKMLKQGIQPEVQAHFVEMLAEPSDDAAA